MKDKAKELQRQIEDLMAQWVKEYADNENMVLVDFAVVMAFEDLEDDTQYHTQCLVRKGTNGYNVKGLLHEMARKL